MADNVTPQRSYRPESSLCRTEKDRGNINRKTSETKLKSEIFERNILFMIPGPAHKKKIASNQGYPLVMGITGAQTVVLRCHFPMRENQSRRIQSPNSILKGTRSPVAEFFIRYMEKELAYVENLKFKRRQET